MSLGVNLPGIDGYVFDGDCLVTSQSINNARLKVMDNRLFDTNQPDNWTPSNYQTFLIGHADYWTIRLGRAGKKGAHAIILQASRLGYGTTLATRIEMVEDGIFLRGEGSAFAVPDNNIGIWTLSFLQTVPLVPNEIN
jgi:hypothetical protein